MKKKNYSFPRRELYGNNHLYNRYVEAEYFNDDTDRLTPPPPDTEQTPRWKNNNRLDIFHTPYDNTDYHEDPYTVAQKFIDRTEMPHG